MPSDAGIDDVDDDGRTALFHACVKGDNDAVNALLACNNGGDVGRSDDEGAFPLHVAAENGHLVIVRALLSHGACVDEEDHFGATAVLRSAAKGHTEVVRHLLEEAGARATSYGETVLLAAASNGHMDLAKYLVNARGADVNETNTQGHTPLMEAAWHGHAEMAAFLCDCGAAVDRADDQGCTALVDASSRGHEAVVNLLLQHGANRGDVSGSGGHGGGALVAACGSDAASAPAIVEMLLAGHVDDVHATWPAPGPGGARDTLLCRAAERGTAEVMACLLAHGARVGVPGCRSPLARAAAVGSVAKATFLLEHGAAVDGAAQTPADERGDTAVVVTAMQVEASPLHVAAARGHAAVVRLLLEHGADVNLRDSQGRRAVEVVPPSRGDIVRMLVDEEERRHQSRFLFKRAIKPEEEEAAVGAIAGEYVVCESFDFDGDDNDDDDDDDDDDEDDEDDEDDTDALNNCLVKRR